MAAMFEVWNSWLCWDVLAPPLLFRIIEVKYIPLPTATFTRRLAFFLLLLVAGLSPCALFDPQGETIMEPISFIVTALTLGIAAGLKPTATQAVQDAYAGLKSLIQRKFENVPLDLLEAKPDNVTRQKVVAEELETAGAGQDKEILQQAQTLVEIVEKVDPDAATTIGVDLAHIKGSSLQISEIIAQGSGQGKVKGVSVENAEIAGDITISKVTASNPSNRSRSPIITGPVEHVGERHVHTEGGGYVEGDVETSGDFIGRDKKDDAQ